jgi:Flp pilus assembly pilin Flp
MHQFRFRLIHDRTGATAIEYALIAAALSLVAISLMATLGSNLRNAFQIIANSV